MIMTCRHPNLVFVFKHCQWYEPVHLTTMWDLCAAVYACKHWYDLKIYNMLVLDNRVLGCVICIAVIDSLSILPTCVIAKGHLG